MYREQYEGCAFWCYYWYTDVITGVLILLLVYWCYYWCNSFSLKLLYLKSDFTLTMVYLNPALNNTAPKFKLLLCFLTFSHVLNNQYHSWNYSTDLTQIVINQEKFEALFCLLQPDRRTPGSTLRALKSKYHVGTCMERQLYNAWLQRTLQTVAVFLTQHLMLTSREVSHKNLSATECKPLPSLPVNDSTY